MRETFRRWSEDELVGKALVAAGATWLVVQVLPDPVISWLRHLWPLVLVGVGALLIWGRPSSGR